MFRKDLLFTIYKQYDWHYKLVVSHLANAWFQLLFDYFCPNSNLVPRAFPLKVQGAPK